MSNEVVYVFAVIGLLNVVGYLINFVAETIAVSRTRADEGRAIEEFCERQDYCTYGCGKGREGSYYGGYYCNSDHK